MSSTVLYCSYVHRQGSCSGHKCTKAITSLDPLASYCSAHYKLKSLSKDRTEVMSVKLDELCGQLEKTDHEVSEVNLELEGHASELSDLRDESAELSATVKRIVGILASPTLP